MKGLADRLFGRLLDVLPAIALSGPGVFLIRLVLGQGRR